MSESRAVQDEDPVVAPALACANLGASLGATQVLHGVGLSFARGSWTAVVGPNGAGKSTLLKCLAGLLPHSGTVQLAGRDRRLWSRREAARQLAWLGQHDAPAQGLTVYDVAMLGRLPHQGWLGAPSELDHAVVHGVLEQTQTWDWRARLVQHLSAGERQRVWLARALAVQAQVLLLDEPLANLDPAHQADWVALMRALVARGTTVVSVLHEVSLALYADDLVVLDQGRVLHHGPCASAGAERALEAVFSHRIAVHRLFHQPVVLLRC